MSAPGAPLRVVTYNVHELADDTAALVRVLRAAAADVVCVQEAPTGVLRARRLAAVAAAAGLRVCAAGRAGAGTALLVSGRVEVLAARVRSLPVPLLRAGRPVRRRGCAEALLRPAGEAGGAVPVAVRSVHLGLDVGERLAHCGRLLAAEGPLAAAGDRLVVAGDLNEAPDGAAQRALRVRLADPLGEAARPATFPARAPRHRIDVVLVGPGLPVVGAGAVEAAEADLRAATDHLPVRADLLVPRA
ncbi:endonuclease/exonuclease/phosphatase family protein [Kineococcus sp. NUM-3379]